MASPVGNWPAIVCTLLALGSELNPDGTLEGRTQEFHQGVGQWCSGLVQRFGNPGSSSRSCPQTGTALRLESPPNIRPPSVGGSDSNLEARFSRSKGLASVKASPVQVPAESMKRSEICSDLSST
jgi:hypothetical protein